MPEGNCVNFFAEKLLQLLRKSVPSFRKCVRVAKMVPESMAKVARRFKIPVVVVVTLFFVWLMNLESSAQYGNAHFAEVCLELLLRCTGFTLCWSALTRSILLQMIIVTTCVVCCVLCVVICHQRAPASHSTAVSYAGGGHAGTIFIC